MATFDVQVFQNEYLPDGGTDVHAVVAITAADTGGAGEHGPAASEIVIVDTSGSMQSPGSKIRAARQAAAVALEEIVDGTWFAVIAGTDRADLAYPNVGMGAPRMAQMSPETRQEATQVVRNLEAEGGTAIGHWLRLATELCATSPAEQHHAILLTDGKNESESPAVFRAAVREAKGVFQCDCRGVGENWVVDELRHVSTELLGSLDLIADPDDMAEDFRAMIRQSMGRGIREAKLRVWTPQGSELLFVRQVAPTIEELEDRRVQVNALTGEYTTGAWGDETREYHVAVRVPAKTIGNEQLASRVQLVIDGAAVAQGLVKAVWSNDAELTTKINPAVAHYTGQEELAEAIHEGLAAKSAGDLDTATDKLGRAVQLAEQTGNDEATSRLKKIVEVVDLDTGTVRLKREISALDEMALDTRSTKTTRVK